ncbi:hypothetical protein EK21DRAFT_90237 [Setomelanomma holmii]|uniref:Uncharacterized protein n=1 Tax=Setomelanomma holmii TaxID=210430 RepID=A0A9P4H732_9PLEO|nr:hypothetical protein EK21DRAFT_90237 [Setomelanomma holmii]
MAAEERSARGTLHCFNEQFRHGPIRLKERFRELIRSDGRLRLQNLTSIVLCSSYARDDATRSRLRNLPQRSQHRSPKNTEAMVVLGDKLLLPSGLGFRLLYPHFKKRILHSSFHATDLSNDLISYSNGFVGSIVRAYQQDLHLILRPDDVCLAISTQFSFYVAGTPRTYAPSSSRTLERRRSTSAMSAAVLEEMLVDNEIKYWIVPYFTTRTQHDTVVASIVMIATFKAYFDFEGNTGCGCPSVTLLDLREVSTYGKELARWSRLLILVLDQFVATFERPKDQNLKDFWLSVVHSIPRKSRRTPTYTGWITAFAVFQCDGKRNEGLRYRSDEPFLLDGQTYPSIELSAIPSSLVEVPVNIDAEEQNTEYRTTIVAGAVGAEVHDEGTRMELQSGWKMVEDLRKPLYVEQGDA